MKHRYFDLAHDMLTIVRADGALVELNDAWRRTLGWPVEALVGRRYIDFVHPDDLRASDETVRTMVANPGTPFSMANRYRTTSGTWRWLEWRAHYDAEEQLIYGAARDITEAVELQERLRDRERTLLRLLDELANMRDAEQQRIAAELHDSSLQHAVAARMYVEAALLDPLPDHTQASLRASRTQLDGCIRSMREIMQGLDPLGLGNVPLAAALAELVVDIERQFSLEVTLDCRLDRDPDDTIAGVAYRAARELLTNVGKHAHASTARLAAAIDDHTLVVTVSDDGRGFAISDANGSPGGGLGLHLLSDRVRRAEGSLSVSSGPQGTTARVRLPLADARGVESAGGTSRPDMVRPIRS